MAFPKRHIYRKSQDTGSFRDNLEHSESDFLPTYYHTKCLRDARVLFLGCHHTHKCHVSAVHFSPWVSDDSEHLPQQCYDHDPNLYLESSTGPIPKYW
jgi:hypothetical protein